MRRTDHEICSIEEKIAVLETETVAHIALCDGDSPYIVPMNFGYSFEDEKLILYFHSAKSGRKIDLISKNNRACFEVMRPKGVVTAEKACDYTFAFSSVIGFGRLAIVEEELEWKKGLTLLMRHHGFEKEIDFSAPAMNRIHILKFEVKEFTGKKINSSR